MSSLLKKSLKLWPAFASKQIRSSAAIEGVRQVYRDGHLRASPVERGTITHKLQHVSFDIIVIGSGAAGLRAAISAREAGLSVCVVSKGSPGKSTCTGFSAGVMAGGASEDQRGSHRQRTVTAGRGLNAGQREIKRPSFSGAFQGGLAKPQESLVGLAQPVRRRLADRSVRRLVENLAL